MINVLYYLKSGEKERGVIELCNRLGLGAGRLSQADLGKGVGELCGMGVKVKPRAQVPALFAMPEIIIFYGMTSQKLDDFLEGYRRSGLAAVDLKAVVTPYNMSWSVYDLILELKEEHERMKR